MGKHNKRKKLSSQQLNDDFKGTRRKELESIKILINRGSAKGYSELINYIEKYPNDPYGHNLLGKILLKRNDYSGAKAEFEKVISAHQKNYHSGITGLARACYLSGEIDNARHYYEEAIENNPFSYFFPYLALASLEVEEENYYRALNILYSALELDDTESKKCHAGSKTDIKIEIAKILISIGKNEEAQDILSAIIPENDEQTRKVAYGKSQICKFKKEYLKAIAYLEEVRNTEQKDKIYYQATIEASQLYQQLRMLDEQYALLEELDRDGVDFDGSVYAALGVAKLIRKDFNGGKATFKKGLSAYDYESRNFSAYNYSALEYLAGNIVAAENILKESLSKNSIPYHANYIALIRLLYDQGRYLEAQEYLAEVRAKDGKADENYSFRRIELLIREKLGEHPRIKDDFSYIERQFVDYNLDSAIAHSTYYYGTTERSGLTFAPSIDIRQLHEDVKPFLITENRLIGNVVDEYNIPYPNIGYVDGNIVNALRVKTIPGTTNIISMHPSPSTLLPTRGLLREETAKTNCSENAMVKKFNERFAKYKKQ